MVSALLMRASPLSAAQRERFSLCFAASRGILFSSVGALLYSCVGVLTKIVCSAGMPILNLLLFRFIVQSVLCVGLCHCLKTRPFKYLNPRNPLAKYLYARGVIAVLCHALYYIALSRLPLGDAAAVGLSATIWAAFLGALIQKEGLGWLWTMVLLCSVGILLIAKPGSMNEALGGGTTPAENSGSEVAIIDDLTKGGAFIILVVGAFLHGVSFVLGRHVAKRGPPILSILLMMFFGLVSFLPLVLIISPFQMCFFEHLQPVQWILLTLLPILGLGAQLCLITALESESAATIAIVQNLDAVFSYTFQLVIGEGFNVASLCGASLIVFSAIILASFKIRKSLRDGKRIATSAAEELVGTPVVLQQDGAPPAAGPFSAGKAVAHEDETKSSIGAMQTAEDLQQHLSVAGKEFEGACIISPCNSTSSSSREFVGGSSGKGPLAVTNETANIA